MFSVFLVFSLSVFAEKTSLSSFCMTISKMLFLVSLTLSASIDSVMHFEILSFLKDSVLSSSLWTVNWIPGSSLNTPRPSSKTPRWVTAFSSSSKGGTAFAFNLLHQKEPWEGWDMSTSKARYQSQGATVKKIFPERSLFRNHSCLLSLQSPWHLQRFPVCLV